MPVCVHAAFTLFFGLEADTAPFMLFTAVLAAGSTGAFLGKWGYGPVAASLGSAWPTVLAVSRHWHWSAGLPSPGGSAQALTRYMGLGELSMPAATAVVLIIAGAAGWLLMRVDRWYEGKTGYSFFDGE